MRGEGGETEDLEVKVQERVKQKKGGGEAKVRDID